jgi:hypothetical protein
VKIVGKAAAFFEFLTAATKANIVSADLVAHGVGDFSLIDGSTQG